MLSAQIGAVQKNHGAHFMLVITLIKNTCAFPCAFGCSKGVVGVVNCYP